MLFSIGDTVQINEAIEETDYYYYIGSVGNIKEIKENASFPYYVEFPYEDINEEWFCDSELKLITAAKSEYKIYKWGEDKNV